MRHQRGFSLIEIVVVIAILSVAFVALGRFSSAILRGLQNDMLTQKASYLAQEGMETTRLLRDQSWSSNIGTLTSGTEYFFARSGSNWSVTSASQPLIENIFFRKVAIFDVRRDSNDNIVQSGGTLDPNTKRVVVRVAWGTREARLETYLTNFLDN